ncbi:hypothetical protein SLEP1_g19850 [Rubroshorea leprosula]|uniref:C2H2-type domain-containing protein n=1 Tax=Rubroshorea leprosula TaxID=152421 RepID=A0AAV5J9W3_9ROSI|nr:hypothetical protein SLEP1_g19850 [Rubroshorea leprosula]
MKRFRSEEAGEVDTANCLMLLSKVGQPGAAACDRFFTCKTCNKQFSSFQALGGHRASHKKPKLMGGEFLELPVSLKKPKTHPCTICGQEFPIGQALGGHMRRHKTSAADVIETREFLPMPVLKKSVSSKRIVCLDLNLTPLENHLKFGLGKLASVN